MASHAPTTRLTEQPPRPPRNDSRTAVGRALLWATVLGGWAALAWAITDFSGHPNFTQACLALAAASVAELLKVTIYEAREQTLSFSLSVVVIMAAVTAEPSLGPVRRCVRR